ncbi:MAG: phenylalanine--tRNA ligase subunit beta [Oscillospiraceae bacterium]|nr:phenylalanine--tRNA ligase subunit beta [Oscillospiraceae bacterium]
MLLPLSWLKEYVNVDGIAVEEIQRKLFSCGFEVEEITYPGGEISRVVVGKITEVQKHPNADTLVVCKLDCGEKFGRDIQIVTGAKNVSAGDVVPVALDGAILHGGVKINKGQLRGEVSDGMLCSGEELGIDDGWYTGAGVDGIMILSPEDRPGTYVKELLGLGEPVFDISVTANRPDCQCILGMAREVAAAFALPFTPPGLDYKTTGTDTGLKVSVLDAQLCPRYVGHAVEDVKIAPSPEFIRRRLILCGINAINNIVDLTNYILLELGQPMHAFDQRQVAGNEIIVRRASTGEKIVTLDEREFTLNPDNLLICDGVKAVALAGIMGGLNSEIKDDTTGVVLESAKFERANIRRSARALGQSSDSSKRFEKGVDEYTTGLAIERALHLIDKYGYGRVTATHRDVWANPDKKNPAISSTVPAINTVLGIEVPAGEIVDILRRLSFEVEVNGQAITATAPPYREDVEGTPDLAEEVIRVYGFEHIKPTMMAGAVITPGSMSREQKLAVKLKSAVMAQGFFETIHYSFYSPRDLDMFGLPEDAPERDAVAIANPISDHYTIMRRTLAPSLLHTVARNTKRGVAAGRLYELAGSYTPVAGEKLPVETPLLCLAAFGAEESYLALKGGLEQIGLAMGLCLTFEKDENLPGLHPGVSAKVLLNGKEIGWIGQLSYKAGESFEIQKPVYLAELKADKILSAAPAQPRFKPLPAFLEVTRDLALVAEETVTNGQIEMVIRAACPAVGQIRLFDIYRGVQVGPKKKSMAYTLTFIPTDKALSPEAVDEMVKAVLGALGDQLGVTIR